MGSDFFFNVLFMTFFFNIISIPMEMHIVNFFQIDANSYLFYSLWLRAISLFNAILPMQPLNMFL